MGLTKPKNAGVTLPELTNPATAENIESGFEAVDGLGNLLTGLLEKAVYGIVECANATTSITIPELIGKNNFVLIKTGDANTSTYISSLAYIDGVWNCHYNSNSHTSNSSVFTFNNTTGEISASARRFSVEFYYIGW